MEKLRYGNLGSVSDDFGREPEYSAHSNACPDSTTSRSTPGGATAPPCSDSRLQAIASLRRIGREPLESEPGTILDALRNHVETQGDSTAYTFLKSDDKIYSITYQELDRRARHVACALLHSAEPGDRALMMFPSGLDFIEAFLGCLYAGIIAVPAYPPKKNRNAERVLSIAKDCVPSILLCSSETKRDVEDGFSESVCGGSVIVTNELESPRNDSLPVISSGQLAFLQYTSGSTAAPKGVMVTHGNIVANEMLIQKHFEFTKESVMVSWLPMFHDMGLIGGLLAPLFVGFPSVLMPPNAFLWRPLRWLQAVSEFRATCTGAPNFAYDLCVSRIKPNEKEGLNLSTLRVAYNGAEPVRAETLRKFTEAFAECGLHPNACFPCYGMAETTLLVSGGPPLAVTNVVTLDQSELEKHRVVDSESGQDIVSCGQIGSDLPVRIVDPETLQECVSDEVGEVWVAGKSIADGYLSRPKETAEAFGFSLDGTKEKWFRTGDYGFLRHGELYITGRLKDILIIRGRNIYPQDIEQRIGEFFQLDSPNAVAAFTVEVEGNETIGIVLEASKSTHQLSRATGKKSSEELDGPLEEFRSMVRKSREWVSQNFEATLSHICVVKRGTFPRTSSGKVMRSKAARDFASGAAVALSLPMTTSCDDKGQRR
ncbi:MAG: fatty acyl-AMP ligase [bacterium]|nr:fatty acyl-AMP ligase [bacterium]